jgi:hypothetical protein
MAEETDNKGLLAVLEEATKGAFAGATNAATTNDNPEPPAKTPEPDKDAPKAEPDAKKGIPEPGEVAEKAPDDEFATPNGLNEKAKADWVGLRTARKKAVEASDKAQAENEALKKRIAELESAQNTEEVKALRQTLEQYEQELTVTALERHPKFKQYFDGQTAALLENAKSIGGEKLANILQLPEGEHKKSLLKDAIIELDEVDRISLGGVITQLRQLNAQKSVELSKSKEALKALESERMARQKAEQEKAIKVIDSVLERWSDPKSGNVAYQYREGDAAWNKAVDERKALARQMYSGTMDYEQLARGAAYAASAIELVSQLRGANAENARLKEEIAALKAAKPTIESGGGNDEGDANMGFLEAVNKQWRGR